MSWDAVGEEVSAAFRYAREGGFVMPVLLGVGVLLWVLLVLRWFLLRKGFSGRLAARLDRPGAPTGGVFSEVIAAFAAAGPDTGSEDAYRSMELAVLETENRISAYRKGIGVLCVIAPLLGLLGTVSGMIETFASLVSMELFAESGGVGGGISEALVSTQMGLMTAVPGVVAGRLLQARETSLRDEMQVVLGKLKQRLQEAAEHE
jgi:biopolymer transport protein ExbB